MSINSMRDGIEQAVLVSIGAAAITRERAEAAVAEFVRRGQLGGDEGRKVVDRLMATVRTGGGAAEGLAGRIEGGVQGVLREVGVATRGEVEDLVQRIAELEHRLALVEGGARAAADPVAGAPAQESPGG
ncbi:MAG: hypothetical protein RIB67_01945 [Miltoncostaeaceae bacterium]